MPAIEAVYRTARRFDQFSTAVSLSRATAPTSHTGPVRVSALPGYEISVEPGLLDVKPASSKWRSKSKA